MPSGRGFVLHASTQMTVSISASDVQLQATIIDGSREQGIRISKLKTCLSYEALETLIGPVVVGLSVGLSAAEVEEALEADPQGMQDTPAMEQTDRKVFPIYMIPARTEVNNRNIQKFETIEDWPFREIDEGNSLDMWAFNIDGSALTAGIITLGMVLTGEWLRD